MSATPNITNISVGIVGASGMAGGELLRLLLAHPRAEVVYAGSKALAGQAVGAAHADLEGETELAFSETPDVWPQTLFLCMGHGQAADWLAQNPPPAETKLIDLSHDFRLAGKNEFSGREFRYGLPELQREAIGQAQYVANPGCFATAIQLALLPLAKSGLLPQAEDLHVSAITGSTGAGKTLLETTAFSWRSANASVYKALRHQHVAEITQSLLRLQPQYGGKLRFVPFRGAFARGILASAYLSTDLSEEEARTLYRDYYAAHPFTSVSDAPVDLKHVVNTNKCRLHLEVVDGQLHVTSVIDNLLKGAAGQAVQNFNLLHGLDETCSLHLKPSIH